MDSLNLVNGDYVDFIDFVEAVDSSDYDSLAFYYNIMEVDYFEDGICRLEGKYKEHYKYLFDKSKETVMSRDRYHYIGFIDNTDNTDYSGINLIYFDKLFQEECDLYLLTNDSEKYIVDEYAMNKIIELIGK